MFLWLGGCATQKALPDPSWDEDGPEDYTGLSPKLREIIETHLDREKPQSDSVIPLTVNSKVRKWLVYFSTRAKDRVQNYLDRGAFYRPQLERLLVENGVHSDLYYLALVESGYSARALSRVGAVGVWQFMKSTGKSYGLDIGMDHDERRDPFRATRSAALFLKDLHRMFGDWKLALAAYNCGPGRVRSAIRRAGTSDFWELSRRRLLPRETRNYVPKFIAAVLIGRNPEKFGFRSPHESIDRELGSVALTKVPGGIPLARVAERANVSESQLRLLNPHLFRGHTPRTLPHYNVWLPASKRSQVERQFASLSRYRMRAPAALSVAYHRVRRGENLTMIARRYSMRLSELKRLNGLRSSRLYVGTRLKVHSSRVRVSETHTKSRRRVRHRVRRGDSLFAIARRYGVSSKQIKEWNRLRRNRIYVGETLTVYAPRT